MSLDFVRACVQTQFYNKTGSVQSKLLCKNGVILLLLMLNKIMLEYLCIYGNNHISDVLLFVRASIDIDRYTLNCHDHKYTN